MKELDRIIRVCGLGLLAACSEPPPPVSVTEFMEDPRILEATMIRCAQDRSQSRYVAECMNAREAVNRLEAAEERTRRESLEQQSERKRQALRRTQQAAAEARRRALEEQRRREEEEYLGIFDQAPSGSGPADSGNTPMPVDNAPSISVEPQPATDAESTRQQSTELEEPPVTDLDAVREELRRRQESTEPR